MAGQFALLHEARTALRAGDLTVSGSQRYAAWDSDLYQSEVWASRRDAWYSEQGLPRDGESFVVDSLDQLHLQTLRVGKRMARHKNLDACVEGDKLKLTALEKVELPPEVSATRTDLVSLFPLTGLPELLMEVNRWTPFAQELTHLTGRRQASAEREAATLPVVFAVLVAEATNLGLATGEVMICASTPLRLPIAGGGTDLPEYFQVNGAELLTATIDQRIYIDATPRSDGQAVVAVENSVVHPIPVDKVEGLVGCVLRERYPQGANITIKSKIDAGVGLGGSGSLAVALVAVLCAFEDKYMSREEIALTAYEIERHSFGASVCDFVAYCGKIWRDMLHRECSTICFTKGRQVEMVQFLPSKLACKEHSCRSLFTLANFLKPTGVEVAHRLGVFLSKGLLPRYASLGVSASETPSITVFIV